MINDSVQIHQVTSFKYLDKNGLGESEIRQRIQRTGKIIGCLNSVWWDKTRIEDGQKENRSGDGRVSANLLIRSLDYWQPQWII